MLVIEVIIIGDMPKKKVCVCVCVCVFVCLHVCMCVCQYLLIVFLSSSKKHTMWLGMNSRIVWCSSE